MPRWFSAHLSWKLKVFLITFRPSSVCLSVRLPVHLSIRLSVCPSVNFSYFRLLLKNQFQPNKGSMGEWDSMLFKEEPFNIDNNVFFSSLNQRYYLIIWVYWFDFLRWAMWPMDLLFIFGFFESSCEAKRLLAIMCIRFLANPRLCKNPQGQLVRVYQRFIYKFSNTFPLHLILSSMVWYF